MSKNLALKRIDHLLFDLHLIVAFPLLDPTADGLTKSAEADSLNALEDELVALLGPHAVLVGHETAAGRRSVHLRVMEGGPARGVVERFLARRPERECAVHAQMDPRWDVVKRWR